MYKWHLENPQFSPYKTWDEAEEYCARIRKVHTDRFVPYEISGGYGIVQDIPGDGPIMVDGIDVRRSL